MQQNPKGGNQGFQYIPNAKPRTNRYVKTARGTVIDVEMIKIKNQNTSDSTTIVFDIDTTDDIIEA